jgi:SAM-dependent methyltransferase
MQQKPVFDLPHYQALNETRERFLRELLPAWMQELNLKTAVDVGCGQGHFSAFLQSAGLRVMACDGRRENVEEAARKYPNVDFHLANVEDSAILELGKFDLVLCFGLLYHLENPFAAIRNLHSMTRQLLLLEGMCIPGAEPILNLRNEVNAEDQGLNFVAFYPTEACLVKMLISAGFPFVYRFRRRPEHGDYSENLTRKQVRTMLAASSVPLSTPILERATDSPNNADIWATGWAKARIAAHRLRVALHTGRDTAERASAKDASKQASRG